MILDEDIECNSDDEEGNFENKVNGDHLSKIFNNFQFDEDDPPEIHFAENVPVVIANGNTTWALMPITDGEEEEDDE